MGRTIETVGIVGAGQMGSGIAHVAALAGYRVRLSDISIERVENGVSSIRGNLARQVGTGKIRQAAAQNALDRITPTAGFAGLSDAQIVIEAVAENQVLKSMVFSELCPILDPHCLLATNTSSISITRLAAQTDRPAQFLGIHFMNPVPVMKLVELVRGIGTDQDSFETACAFVATLGKTVIVAEDVPAFIVNRVLLPMINEAVYTLYEGVGTVTAIDTGMKLGANHPLGPLQLADFIGLDTCLSIMRVLHEGLADSKYLPCPLLVNYVEAGWLGRKSGRGFYDYTVTPPQPTR
jgi:3-hydroxybutyryl-CoA dehydrogenase